MNPTTPPPLPQTRGWSNRHNKLIVCLALIPAFVIGVLFVLRIFGLIQPFSVPTEGMSPAISVGDHVMMEGVTYLAREPHRGDIIVFRTDDIASLPQSQICVKRVAGEPGDHLRISAGQLYINDKHVALSNAVGEIAYNLPPGIGTQAAKTDLTVPEGYYFVLGDNSTNSLDSRFWGCLPRANVKGRILFCYWPPDRVGGVK